MTQASPVLTYNSALAIAEYIFQKPGQSKTQILKDLAGIVSSIDFDMAEDFLGDNALIFSKWGRRGEVSWVRVYMPNEKRSLDSVRDYIKKRFLILPGQYQ